MKHGSSWESGGRKKKEDGWGPQGEDRFLYTEGPTLTLSVIAAISEVAGSVTTEVFTDYLKKLLSTLEGRGPFVLWLDNCGVHREDDATVSGTQVVILRNVPYSPPLNPIEEVFGFWKRRVRKWTDPPATVRALLFHLGESLQEIDIRKGAKPKVDPRTGSCRSLTTNYLKYSYSSLLHSMSRMIFKFMWQMKNHSK